MKKPPLTAAYRTAQTDIFPRYMKVSFSDEISGPGQEMIYEKVGWKIDGLEKGLRYGENPEQSAAFYRLRQGALRLGDVNFIEPGRGLVSAAELLQSGKHPGKTNLTDIDSALNILRFFNDTPFAVLIKHNNPCGAAQANSLADAYQKAWLADRIAAFGGALIVNRCLDAETAELIEQSYLEVVAAPDFDSGALARLGRKKNLRVIQIKNLTKIDAFAQSSFLEIKSLLDGSLIVQNSFNPLCRKTEDFFPASCVVNGQKRRIKRLPSQKELADIRFGWLVECGVTSNSIIYVKDGATLGIGAGEQDRVGVARIARDKAYRNAAERLAWVERQTPLTQLSQNIAQDYICQVKEQKAGLPGSVMISDAFFPFKDGVEVGLNEGVSAVAQPGGSLRDHEVIEACDQAEAAMVFTGQRCFRH